MMQRLQYSTEPSARKCEQIQHDHQHTLGTWMNHLIISEELG